ncbi:YDG domain-containing protein [Hymenobacter sp. 15J16-1T3B]|uniref:YDG domain-containing protein n=1 Tax=Hymenobacter sp. 15J16-1T3B TaxID=2886941 RepID=UPI001D127D1F|nr:YDG domain-containing protein [Hymenobacter sp. 15J16-1T3B]MCC3156661.1 YDG domain-containing protein [Hymenobacter sp. 15J16-1T3B]
MRRARGRSAGFWLCLLLSFLTSLNALAQVANVYTDKPDYLPGDIVVIEGNGWQPGEEVRLEIDHSTITHGNTVLTAMADPNGHIYNDQFVIQPIHLGEAFTLAATGQSSGLTAQTTFTDGDATLVTALPSTSATCAGATKELTAAANGSSNAATSWQSSTNGTSWANIFSGSGGYTITTSSTGNTTTSTLSFTASTTQNNLSFRATFGGSGSGAASVSTVTVLTVTSPPTAPNVSAQTFCAANNPTVASLPTGSGSYKWYSSLGATTALTSTTALTNSTYYVSATTNSCESARTAVAVTLTPTVGTPSAIGVTPGTEPTCQFTSNQVVTTSYSSSATNSTGLNWSLSPAGAGSITSAGVVTWTRNYTGTATIQVTASGCGGPSAPTTRTVTLAPRVGTLTFALGTTSSRCQGAGTVTYTATAANATSITYALDATSLAAGNSIVATTGVVTYVAGYSGSSTITATADGCGPVVGTHTVGTLPLQPFYRDADGDTYGNAALVLQACSAPAGYVSNADDCNDAQASIRPGAPEVCGNGIDDDCDGQVDEGCTPVVASIAPTSGAVGALVTVGGSLFAGATAVSFGGTTTTAFTVNGAGTSISVTVPAGALSGPISVTTANGVGTSSTSFTVLQPPTLAFADINKTYGDATFALSATTNSPGAITYSVVSGSGASVSPAGQVVITGAGSVQLKVSQAASSPYLAAEQTATLTIAPATPGIIWLALPGITYGADLSGSLTATAAFQGAAVPGTFVYRQGGAVVTAATKLNAQATAYALTVDFTPSSGNFAPASASNTLAVAKADQFINWAAPAAIDYGTPLTAGQLNATVAGVAQGSATGAVTYTPAAGTVLDAGPDQALTVEVAATPNYNAATTSVLLTVRKVDPSSVTATGGQFPYDRQPHGGTGSASGLGSPPAGLTPVELSYSGTGATSYGPTAVAPTQAGTYVVVATYTGSTNYNAKSSAAAALSITPQTLTPTYAAADKDYDATADATLTGVVVGGVLDGDVVNVSGGTAAFADKHVGPGKTVTVAGVSLTGADAGNYRLPVAPLTTTATIRARMLTVTGLSAGSRAYDGTLAAPLTGTPALLGVPPAEIPGAVTLSGTAVGTFASAGVGTSKAVTVSGLALSGPGNGNYALTLPTALVADINAKALTPAFSAADKSYDGTTDATITARSLDGVVPGETVTLTGGTAAFATPAVGTNKLVTATGFGLSGSTIANYDLAPAPVTTTASITALQLTPHITANGKTYDGTTNATLASQSVTGLLPGETAVALVVGSQQFDDARVGARTVTASGLSLSGDDAGNYQLAPGATASAPASITAKSLTAAIGAADKDYDGTMAATIASRSLTGVVPGDAVQLTGGTAAFADKHVGTGKTVTASALSLAGNDAGNYNLPNPTATTTASIRPRALLVSASGGDKLYDGSTATTVTLSDNRVGGDVLTATYATATFANKNVGAGKTVTVSGISLDGADAGNYAANATASVLARISPRALSISARGQHKTYDGTIAATVTLSDDRVGGDVLTTGYAAASFDDAAVGQHKLVSVSGITVGGADAGNYTPNTTASTYANITARGLVVTADAQSKVYGAAEPPLTYQTSGLLPGDALSGGLSRAAGENAGPYAIGQGDLANANYSITFTGATLTITPKPITGTFAAAGKVYDGSTSAAIGSRALVGVLPVDINQITLSGGTATFADKHAGIGKTVTGSGFALAGPAAGNYSLTSVASALADITPKSITGGIAAADKVYDGGTAAQLTDRTLNGVIGNDEVSLTGGTAAFGNKLVGTGKTVTGTGQALSGADAGNYTLSAVGPTLASITAKSLTGSITAADKVYDGSATATITGRSLTGVVPGDAVQLTGGTAAFADKHVGTGKTVSASALSLAGNDAGNYNLPNPTATTTASITAKGLVIGITASDKVYDRTRAATVGASISSGLVLGDAVSVGATGGEFDTKNVGTGKTVTAAVSKTGADAGNYTANATATAAAAITPKPLTATITALSKVYDGGTAATLSAVAITPPTDVISPDAVTVAASNPLFDLPTVGSRTVTAGVALGGADAGNYQLTAATASATASITERAVTVTASANQGKVYGAAEPPLTYGISAGSLAPGDAFSGQLARTPGQNAGSYAIGLGSLALNANYTLTLTPGATFVITPKALTPVVTASNKVYDGNTSADVLPQALTGLVGNDAVVLEANGSKTFASKTAGTGKTVTAAGLTLGGAQAGNYVLSTTTATTTADITPKTVTGNITAADKVYDGSATATVTGRSLTGVVPGDAVQLTGGTATFDTKHVGTGKTVTASGLSIAGTDVSNYSLASSPVTTTASITAKAAAVTPTATGKEYGAPEPPLAGTLTGFVGLDNITATYNRTPGEDVGGSPYTISATLSPAAALSNYTITYNTAPFAIGQAELTVTATSFATQYSQPKPTFGVSFSGFRNGDNAGVVSGAAALACPAAFSAATPPTVNSPAGTYAITPSVGTLSAPNYRFRFVPGTLTVTEETGLVSYTGQTYFATASPTSTTATLLLTAQAQDDPDGSRGDIVNKAVVDFRTNNNLAAPAFMNQAANLTRPIGYITPGVGTDGLATSTSLAYTLSGSEVNQCGTTLTVAPVLNAKNGSFYTGAAQECTTITISVPGQDNISGGGFVLPTNSVGQYAAAPGSRTNFGFTMKYNNSGRNLQGQANIIVRSGGANYQFKSNAINSLTLSDYKPGATVVGKKAVFNTKANLTNLTTGLSLGGNLDLTVEVVQATVAGGKDMVSIRVTDAGSNLLYANNWTGTKAELQNLDGGKISVRSTTAARDAAEPTATALVAPETATAATVAAVRTTQLPGRPTLTAAPNPFAERALIEVDFSADDAYRLDLYDLRGALLKHLQAGTARAGAHVAVPCDNTGLPVGLYLVRLTTKYGVQHLRLVRE